MEVFWKRCGKSEKDDWVFKIPRYLFITRYGSRVRDGEGRFITFVFFFIDKKGDSIENNKIKGYKSTLTIPHPCPIH